MQPSNRTESDSGTVILAVGHVGVVGVVHDVFSLEKQKAVIALLKD